MGRAQTFCLVWRGHWIFFSPTPCQILITVEVETAALIYGWVTVP